MRAYLTSDNNNTDTGCHYPVSRRQEAVRVTIQWLQTDTMNHYYQQCDHYRMSVLGPWAGSFVRILSFNKIVNYICVLTCILCLILIMSECSNSSFEITYKISKKCWPVPTLQFWTLFLALTGVKLGKWNSDSGWVRSDQWKILLLLNLAVK